MRLTIPRSRQAPAGACKGARVCALYAFYREGGGLHALVMCGAHVVGMRASVEQHVTLVLESWRR